MAANEFPARCHDEKAVVADQRRSALSGAECSVRGAVMQIKGLGGVLAHAGVPRLAVGVPPLHVWQVHLDAICAVRDAGDVLPNMPSAHVRVAKLKLLGAKCGW